MALVAAKDIDVKRGSTDSVKIKDENPKRGIRSATIETVPKDSPLLESSLVKKKIVINDGTNKKRKILEREIIPLILENFLV